VAKCLTLAVLNILHLLLLLGEFMIVSSALLRHYGALHVRLPLPVLYRVIIVLVA
jgi:hypothetical protein